MNSFVQSILQRHLRLIRKSTPEKLLKIISAIEYIEGIFEITASKLFGEKFKWLIILLTQLAKSVIRLGLMLFHKIAIQPTPALFSISSFLSGQNTTQQRRTPSSDQFQTTNENGVFNLKHSGHPIRTIHNAPEINERTWQFNSGSESLVDYDVTRDTKRMVAEIFYITRPLCHLACLYAFGSRSWTQFFVPFVMDLTNLLLINGKKNLSKKQKDEMKRRTYAFLYYLIRSPFYETCSKSLIEVILNLLEQYLPLLRILIKPARNYIPEWRSVYNYCWSS